MLQSQVNYWANQEQKRHNRSMEDLEASSQRLRNRELAIKQQDANTKAVEALTSQTNAATQQKQAETAQYVAESGRIQALASQQQAVISERLANSQIERNKQQNILDAARTAYTKVQSDFYAPAQAVGIADDIGSIIQKLPTGKIINKVKSIFKKG